MMVARNLFLVVIRMDQKSMNGGFCSKEIAAHNMLTRLTMASDTNDLSEDMVEPFLDSFTQRTYWIQKKDLSAVISMFPVMKNVGFVSVFFLLLPLQSSTSELHVEGYEFLFDFFRSRWKPNI